MKQRLLLHTCCGPCSTHCIEELKVDHDVTLLFYNPNIHPMGEYLRRREAAEKVASSIDIPIIEIPYTPEAWVEHTKGFEEEPEGGRRCGLCFSQRMEATAIHAKENGFDCFTTTMTISPHKDAKLINEIGEKVAEKHGVRWLHSDFKKNDGFRKSTEMSKELGIYRQHYCGCFYSVRL